MGLYAIYVMKWRCIDTFPFQNCKPGISLNYLHHQTTLEIGQMLKGVHGVVQVGCLSGCHGYIYFLM